MTFPRVVVYVHGQPSELFYEKDLARLIRVMGVNLWKESARDSA